LDYVLLSIPFSTWEGHVIFYIALKLSLVDRVFLCLVKFFGLLPGTEPYSITLPAAPAYTLYFGVRGLYGYCF